MRLLAVRVPLTPQQCSARPALWAHVVTVTTMILLLPKSVAPFCRNLPLRLGPVGSTAKSFQQRTAFRPRRFASTTAATDGTSVASSSSSSSSSSLSALVVNPTLEWKGSAMSTSEFANHVLVQADEAPLSVVDAVERVLSRRRQQPEELVTELTATELIGMGSVWFLPVSAPRDPSQGSKPVRLGAANATGLVLEEGDYLRVHHYPRRFRACAKYDWSKLITDKTRDDLRPGVIVAENNETGWVVIDKPPMVPVHMTVDNSQENVAACLQQARTNSVTDGSILEELPYVTTPQRLDQNTSGLLVVATSKVFSAYFAKLLSNKTEQQLGNADEADVQSIGGIHKLYRCLVCLLPPSLDDDDNVEAASWSVSQATAQLQSFVNEGKVLRHYLEPSIRAPKRFVSELPKDTNWPECLLKVRKVGPACALVGNQAGNSLATALWNTDASAIQSSERIPANCQAVMELEIELLTGRTHQIRGQMSLIGFPLVGDAQYGGARPANNNSIGSEQLALQCCELEFLDPDIVTRRKGKIGMNRSKRWNRFRVEEAWWTPLVQRYQEESKGLSAEDATTSASDVVFPEPPSSAASTRKQPRPELLPDRVSLSPGKHKYVLVKATHSANDDVFWFVKSAPPSECGGPYHGNVAQDLLEWIEAAGYDATVTGGGRIDYRRADSLAVVYGFSYGFGMGDHKRAASLIEEWSEGTIDAVHDNSEGLY